MAKFISIIPIALLPLLVSCIIQETIIYGQDDTEIRITTPQPDLETSTAFLGEWTGVCFKGWWEGYTQVDFGGNPIGFYISEEQFCYLNISSTFQNLTKSLKHLGLSDTDEPVITFYTGSYYTGENLTIRDNQVPQFTMQVNSLVTQGYSEWTLYELPDYQGNYSCVNVNSTSKVTTLGEFFIYDLPSIGSLTRGCVDYDDNYDLLDFPSDTLDDMDGSTLFE